MLKLIKFLKPFSANILLVFVLLFVQAFCELMLPGYMSDIVNNGVLQMASASGGDAIRYILKIGGVMLGIAMLAATASITVGLLASRIAAGLGKNLRSAVFTKVNDFSTAEFNQFSTATLITRCTNDINQIQNLLVFSLRVLFFAPIMGIGSIIRVFQTGSHMTWIIAVALVGVMLLVAMMLIFAAPKFKIVQSLIDKVNQVARESLNGIMVVRAFGTEKHEEEKFDKANRDVTAVTLTVSRWMSTLFPLMSFLMNITTVAIVWYGTRYIDAGWIQVGDMMAFIQYATQTMMSFLMISFVSFMLPRAMVSARRIDEVLEAPISIETPMQPKSFDAHKKGIVEFQNVSFKYPDADEYMLENITFTANPGETTAFIGSTGSGKSTLVNLIPRFYDVTDGQILVEGQDIRQVNLHQLRDKIGYIPQKGLLFSGTIESNIKFGNAAISDETMEKAADIAQASRFIAEKEDHYGEPISQGGTNVSGGQRQRLSIARAIAKNPAIYIFDDSFSALDFQTDLNLRQALAKEIHGATILIVAQRLSTIRNATQIIVLENGKIAGKGTHEELMENCQVYQEIAKSQLSKEETA